MLKIAIIEDEKLASMDLMDMLKRIDHEIDVVSILPTVTSAIEFFNREPLIDLIFSDIELPDGLSFEIFKATSIKVPVIFCTAYNEYALEAFESNGIHYILKPYSKQTLAKALDKYLQLKATMQLSEDRLTRIVSKFEAIEVPQKSIIINKGDRIIPIRLDEIALFCWNESMAAAITFAGEKFSIAQSLDEIEKGCGEKFFRANRQYLVNRTAIKEASRHVNRKIVIHLTVPWEEQVLVGKLKASTFLEWLTKI